MATFSDDLLRVENPLSTLGWANVAIDGGINKLRSNAGAFSTNTADYGSEYVSGVSFTADQEVSAQVATIGNTGGAEICALFARLANPGGSSVSGYELEVDQGGAMKVYRIQNWATQTQIITSSHALAAGNWVKLRVTGTNPVVITIFWSSDGVNWTQVATFNDSAATRVQTGSRVGLEVLKNAPRIKNFFATDYPPAGPVRNDEFFAFI